MVAPILYIKGPPKSITQISQLHICIADKSIITLLKL